MKRSFSTSSVISLVLLAVLVTFLITNAAVTNDLNQQLAELELDKIEYGKLSTVDSIVREHYALSIDGTAQSEGSIAGFVEGLGDGYSRYLSPDEYAKYLEEKLVKDACDLGFEICLDSATGAPRISYVAKGSEAENFGLQLGDTVLSIGKAGFSENGFSALQNELQGAEGSSVGVQISREGEPVTYTLTYQARTPEFVSSHMLFGQAGYVRIRAFEEKTAVEVKNAVVSLLDLGADAIVFDVRALNSQGFDFAVRSADVIAPLGGLARIVSAGGVTETLEADAEAIPISCAVLVDENTSGASELFAALLRDTASAQLVGVRSAGCAALLTDIMLNDESALILATRVYLPPVSESFHGAGLAPDLEITPAVDFRLISPAEDQMISEAYYLLKPQRRPQEAPAEESGEAENQDGESTPVEE